MCVVLKPAIRWVIGYCTTRFSFVLVCCWEVFCECYISLCLCIVWWWSRCILGEGSVLQSIVPVSVWCNWWMRSISTWLVILDSSRFPQQVPAVLKKTWSQRTYAYVAAVRRRLDGRSKAHFKDMAIKLLEGKPPFCRNLNVLNDAALET